jgi:cell division septation protein DedD
MSVHPDNTPSTAEIVQRRLVGLAVLLVLVFLLSWLLRGLGGSGTVDEEGLQTVVVPLGGSTAPLAPLPEEGEVSAEPEPATTREPTVDATVPPAADTRPSSTIAAAPPPRPAAPASPPAGPAAEAPAPRTSSPAGKPVVRWYVLLGAFGDANNAKALAQRGRQAGLKMEVSRLTSGGSTLHRVRAGPYSSEREGQSARAQLIVEGLTTAKLVKED